MKKFLIKVNGNQYEVEVEEIKEGQTTAAFTEEVQYTPPVKQAEKKPAVEPKAKPEPAPAKTAAAVPEGAEPVKAPIPGTVLKIEVKTGDQVKKGDVLLLLEAMKMENEIISPFDGTVTSVNVETGGSVNSGDVLVTIG
jgi:biotin carboxyl carrier protein